MEVGGDDYDYGAFIQRIELRPTPRAPEEPSLPLQGLTFAVKDIFDINGYVTGFGNPDWARTHAAATSTSPVVLAILAAGAICVGKTIMDEMAYSINGENKHYGTPTNPCAPDRVPGGSSSGSAVAVAAKLVDFSLGTDTGGSVRVPAAYCGIFGFRPSHGIISTMNVIPMAQIFDTVGWFARDLTTLTQVGRVLLPLPIEATKKASRIVIPTDGFELLCSSSDKTYHILNASVEKIFGCDIIDNENLGEYISKNVPSIGNFISSVLENQACKIPALAALSHSMRLLQRFEFKANHGEWIYAVRPNLGPGIQERVSEVLTTKYENMECCYGIRAELQACLTGLLGDSGVLAIPTVPGPPPKLSMEAAALEDFRARAFCLLSIAGMSGFCQISIPLGMHNNLPVSVSLLAKQGADHFLLSIATELYAALKEQASMVWESDNSTA
ncbi:amidase 1 isoform X1 [Ananas comosus]|uniref:Amidase 1 isoform X1 n=2 Tax=Ananas comosus TaxID=4615 RepID=A0A6P5ETY9_ANACO|nr:amidase 1 isoform X1 [Ananas comosus]